MGIAMEDDLGFDGLMAGKERPSRSLSEQAYQLIRRKIISLELPPGGIVDEALLKEELGLGRTPIREALLRLSLEKLVTIVPRRGIFVTDIVITDLQRLFEIRLELESLAARLAARRGSEEHWERMEEVLGRLPSEDQPADNEIMIGVDEMCHRIMYEATENKFLQDTLITLYALSLRLWYYFLSKIGDMRGALEEHRRILDALKDGDETLAGELIEKHIRAFQVEIQASMLGESLET
jgi:DNA-binding GntR family transcriptional regulator